MKDKDDLGAQVFSFPRWKRNYPQFSYKFEMRNEGPAITVAYGGENLVEYEMPWEEFVWCYPCLWPALVLKTQLEDIAS